MDFKAIKRRIVLPGMNSAMVKLMGSELLTVRVDLD
jgi:hypothetical protein